MKEIWITDRITMKKLGLLAIAVLLTGCSGGGVTTEIYSQTIESTNTRETAQTSTPQPKDNVAKQAPKANVEPAPKKTNHESVKPRARVYHPSGCAQP